MSLGPLYVYLGEVSVQVLCPFFKWVVCLPGVESCEFFIYFGDQALVWGIIGNYVFPYCWFSLYFSAVFLAMQKLFILMRSYLFILSFMSPAELWVLIAQKRWRSHSYGVQMESLSKCPDLWFWVFQAPTEDILLHPSTSVRTLPNISVTVVADSDSMLDCQKY